MLPTLFNHGNTLLEGFFRDDIFDGSILSAPKAEVKKEDDSWKISIAALGFKKEDLTIETTDNTVSISGEVSEDVPGFISQKRFKRSWELADLDSDAVNAKLENGILTVILKTKETADADKKTIVIQ